MGLSRAGALGSPASMAIWPMVSSDSGLPKYVWAAVAKPYERWPRKIWLA